MNIINNHVELASLAASLETSIEVMEVIADKANGDINEINYIWINGDKDLEQKAFEKTEEEELNWGDQTIYRYPEDVRDFVEKHIHTHDDGHDYMPQEAREQFTTLFDVKEWVLDSFHGLDANVLSENDLAILQDNDELIAECAAKYIVARSHE